MSVETDVLEAIHEGCACTKSCLTDDLPYTRTTVGVVVATLRDSGEIQYEDGSQHCYLLLEPGKERIGVEQ